MSAKRGKGPLGRNVLYLRTQKGLTRRAVADAIGIDDDQPLYAMESRNSTRSELAPALAKYFNVDLELLVTSDLTGMSIPQIEAMSRDLQMRKGVEHVTRPPKLPYPDLVTVTRPNEDHGLVRGDKLLRLITLFLNATDKAQDQLLDLAEIAEKRVSLPGSARENTK